MSIITRNDGTEFVIPNYRELLSNKKKSLLKKELELFAENYGQQVYVYKKNKDQYEVAFGSESGILLSETIWNHFDNSENLIYFEVLPESSDALLVVVRSGSIYIEKQLPAISLAEELIVLNTQPCKYEIFLCGDFQAHCHIDGIEQILPEDYIKSVTVIDELSLFEALPCDNLLALKPFTEALKQSGITGNHTKVIIITLAASLVIGGVWHYISNHKQSLPVSITNIVDPYSGYYSLLEQAHPSQKLNFIVDNTVRMSQISGWQPTALDFDKNQLDIQMLSKGANFSDLNNWANNSATELSIDDSGTHAIFHFNNYSKNNMNKIYFLNDVVSHLLDNMHDIIPNSQISLSAITDHTQYKQVDITINFNEQSLATLQEIAKRLTDLPVALDKATLTNNAGLISGSIQLTAAGN